MQAKVSEAAQALLVRLGARSILDVPVPEVPERRKRSRLGVRIETLGERWPDLAWVVRDTVAGRRELHLLTLVEAVAAKQRWEADLARERADDRERKASARRTASS